MSKHAPVMRLFHTDKPQETIHDIQISISPGGMIINISADDDKTKQSKYSAHIGGKSEIRNVEAVLELLLKITRGCFHLPIQIDSEGFTFRLNGAKFKC